MRLFTIGDSISQGFMSGAAARTDLCYSTLIAQALGLVPGEDYHFPRWEQGGHPVNLELLLRRLERLYGSDIAGPIEWPLAAKTIMDFLDAVEDYYERGPGAPHEPDPGGRDYYHNVAVRGFDVADAWLVTPRLCRDEIRRSDEQGGARDQVFATPSASFYRTALSVLDPQRRHEDASALAWLEAHATDETGEGGVENLILWLGSNNALGTVVDLDVVPTPADPKRRPVDMPRPERVHFNLWHPDDFAVEYEMLLDKVDAVMRRNVIDEWRVFLATVPAVTVAPLAKGVGEALTLDDPFGHLERGARYYKYYTYFVFEEDFAHASEVKLSRDEAYGIDTTIAEYNRIIEEAAAAKGERYVVVDINKVFLELAYKRNNANPTYELPRELRLQVPRPNTKYYHATREGRVQQGGIFSLDGVHPSGLGQGLLAHEFLKAMQAEGVPGADPAGLDWRMILARDSLWSGPVRLMRELYQHETLAETLVGLMRRKSRRTEAPSPRPPRGPL